MQTEMIRTHNGICFNLPKTYRPYNNNAQRLGCFHDFCFIMNDSIRKKQIMITGAGMHQKCKNSMYFYLLRHLFCFLSVIKDGAIS